VEAEIERLRRLRMTSAEIAATLELAVSTVCAVLERLGLNRLWKLGPPEPPNRYCRRHAGELVHVDVKKLGRYHRPGRWVIGTRSRTRSRGAGWEAVHVCRDDATRRGYVEVLPTKARSQQSGSSNVQSRGSPSATCTLVRSSATTPPLRLEALSDLVRDASHRAIRIRPY
jgi:hypothetical protein